MKRFASLLVLVTVLAPLSGFAGSEHHQNCRIRQGARSGEITPKEIAQFKFQQAESQELRLDNAAASEEKAKPKHREAKMTRSIYQQKHD